MAERLVITGASGGIGAALAEELARPGVEMLLMARQSDLLSAVAQRCMALGACVRYLSVDVRDRDAVAAAVAEFAVHGEIELVIANAGVVSLEQTPGDAGPDWDQLWNQVNDNLACTCFLLEAALRLPTGQRSSLHCVVVSSMNALMPVGEAPGYSAAKAAQKALVEALEDYYACRRKPSCVVRFTTVFPGFVATGMAKGYRGPRPFELTAQQAACRIVNGINAKHRRIIFPRRLAILLWFKQALPSSWTRLLIASSRAFRDPST